MGFIESESLDPFCRGIEEIIGVYIERLIMDIIRKRTSEYGKDLVPPNITQMIREGKVDLNTLMNASITDVHLNSYGKYRAVDFRIKGEQDD